jgi:subtilisin family serine protease
MTRAATLALILGLAGCAGLPGAPRSAPDQAQLLVMVTETALPRFQPGAAGPAGYSSVPARNRSLRLAQAIAHDHGLSLQTDWPMPALGLRCFVMRVRRPMSLDTALAALAVDARVESAQPVQRFTTAGGGDPYAALQSSMHSLRLEALHRQATGKGVRVAQVDTGVDRDHPDLARRVVGHRNFVDGSGYRAEVHGTAVAGIIVAERDNGVGMAGVAPDARLLALRACWAEPPGAEGAACTSFTLAKALQHALSQRVRLINLSLTGPRDRVLERLLDVAAVRGVVLIGAASGGRPGFPASHPAVIAVSVQPDAAPGSALTAPGNRVLSTAPGGTWGYFSGSSYAAAHVSGVAAVLLERSPGLTPDALRAALVPASGVGPPAVLDACGALMRVAATGGASAAAGSGTASAGC